MELHSSATNCVKYGHSDSDIHVKIQGTSNFGGNYRMRGRHGKRKLVSLKFERNEYIFL